MPVLRVSQQTYDELAKLREGFESAEKTLAKTVALALLARERGLSVRPGAAFPPIEVEEEESPAGIKIEGEADEAEVTFLPQGAFRAPLLECMAELNGAAPVREIRKLMERKLGSRLGEGDRALQASGAVRWWNFVQWNRQNLVHEGLFRPDSRRGTWELSDKGKKYVANGRR